METILEQQRRYHEERERLMDAMVKEMLHKKSGVRLNCLKVFIENFCQVNQKLLKDLGIMYKNTYIFPIGHNIGYVFVMLPRFLHFR